MTYLERIDGPTLGRMILEAKKRVLICAPGFADDVAAALINCQKHLGSRWVQLIVDGSDQAARLGYGHFDAIEQLVAEGVTVRVEPGIRLGIAIIDDRGWCFASPPLLVDATMEWAPAPNAIRMTVDQISITVQTLAPMWLDTNQKDRMPEIGRSIADSETIQATQVSLQNNPPQKFDIARKVTVFNAFVEFVELELLGTQLNRQRIALPNELLLAISDVATRDRLTASFQLISPESGLAKRAAELRRTVDEIRKTHTRSIGQLGSVCLKANRQHLVRAVNQAREAVNQFREDAEKQLQDEIDSSRQQLVKSIVPGLLKKPSEDLRLGVVGEPTNEQVMRWVDAKLEKALPKPHQMIGEMQILLTFKSVTYETLIDSDFQSAVRKAFPLIDFDKPFKEFSAAPPAGE